jgi:hypothetical protein
LLILSRNIYIYKVKQEQWCMEEDIIEVLVVLVVVVAEAVAQ